MEKDAFYFTHDSNASNDPKCVLLIEQLGLEGYGIFWVLIETLREQSDYRYPLNLLPALARRYNTTQDKMRVVIMNYGLFTVIDDKLFCSESLIRRMMNWDRKRELASAAGKASAAKRLAIKAGSADVQQTFNGCSTDIQPIREDIIREDINKDNNIYNVILEFWNSKNIIVHKKLSDKVKRKIKATIDLYSHDEVKKAINNYATILHDDKYFWSYKWTLEEFLQRGFEKFLHDACFENFRNDKNQNKNQKPSNIGNFESRKQEDEEFESYYRNV